MQAASPLPMQINSEDFQFFQTLIRDLAGITLSDGKQELVQSRLRSHVLQLGLPDFSAYRGYLNQLSTSDPEWQALINLLTTNKTDWFREPQHFDILANHFLPAWKKLGKNKLNVWCAASSTGEEPYTLALVLDKELRGSNITFDIVATDIDTQVLSTAQNGVYTKDRLSQVPEKYQKEGFDFGTQEIASWVRVKKRLKDRIQFENFNLAQNQYPWKEKFDVIFCRNVLIYFSPAMTQSVVERAFASAAKDSFLFIAHSESLQNIKTSWKYVQPSLYRKGSRLVW